MKWLAVAGAAVFAILLLLYLVGEAWQAPLLTDPAAQLRRADPLSALLGVALLVVDAVLPVPASLVMIALGAVFGALLGTLLAALGTMGATLVGFGLGRRGGAFLDTRVSAQERARANRLLERWGALAIVVTRPVPLLAETTAILAGASSLGWERATLAAFAGAVPTALVYALTGALAVGLGSNALVFAAALVMLGAVWLADRHLARHLARTRRETAIGIGGLRRNRSEGDVIDRGPNGSRRPRRIAVASPRGLTRRHVVGGALGTVGATVLTTGLLRPGGGVADLSGAAQAPVVQLPIIHEIKSQHGLLPVDLYVRPGGSNEFGFALCDDPTNPYCLPLSPGPTLRLVPGDRLRLRLQNDLEEETNLHVHGLHVTPRGTSDNIFVHIHPGDAFHYDYQIPLGHRPGLFWYHPHLHGRAQNQVEGGLAGVIVIDEHPDAPPELREPAAVKSALERLLVFQRLPAPARDVKVNGEFTPEIRFTPGTWERWRILNASSHTFINLYLEGVDFYRVADDGNWLAEAVRAPVVPVGPAERAEVLVYLEDRPSFELTTVEAIPEEGGRRAPVFPPSIVPPGTPLATLVPPPVAALEAATPVPAEPPTKLFVLPDLRGIPDKPERTLRLQFEREAPQSSRFKIDGKAFHPERIDQTVELDGVEEWTILSETGPDEGWHPLHIHVNDFQVDEIKLAEKNPVLDPVLQELYDPVFFTDTVPVPIGGSAKLIAEFLDFTGKFVYHCHFLDHEDKAMMGVIDVAKSVRIAGSSFSEPTITVHTGPSLASRPNSGTSVVWTNSEQHDRTHTITADAVDPLLGGAIFASGELARGRSFAHTFDAPGTFTYRCSCPDHAGVTGRVEVTAEQAIDVYESALLPTELKIAVGTRITWTNRDTEPRTVTVKALDSAETTVFTSGALALGGAASHTFTETGDFVYDGLAEVVISDGKKQPHIVARPVTRQSVSIGVFDSRLQHPDISVFRDSTVTWTNRSAHFVTIEIPGASPSGELDPEVVRHMASALSPGQRFTHTFGAAGDVKYTVAWMTDPAQTKKGTISVVEPVELFGFGGFAIEPPEVTIAADAEIGWINRDAVAHTITADALEFATSAPVFDQGAITPGAVSRLRFPTVGEFTYRCTAHPEHALIEGKVIVVAAPET